jgi:DNA modification methylase
MGKKWDYDVPSIDIWREALRVLKPGGHLLSFGGTRTYHRMAVAVEDAGFEIRDQIQWLYGSGFPKSHNLKDEWQGWGSALKPANEPICLARKPLSEKTLALNVQRWGTGGLNIDASRVEAADQATLDAAVKRMAGNEVTGWVTSGSKSVQPKSAQGRFPANLILDEQTSLMLDEQSGQSRGDSRLKKIHVGAAGNGNTHGHMSPAQNGSPCYSDSGGASRFFLRVKYDNAELCGNENIKAAVMSVGRKTVNRKDNLNIDGSMRKPMDQFQMGTISITEMGTHSIMSFPILNASTKIFTGTCTIETARTIEKSLVENVEGVSVVSDTEVLLHLPNEKQERITGIVNLALESISVSGEIKTVNIGTHITESTGASRFLYCAKASKSERNGSTHPTMKPIKLMTYLCRLITPPKGIILDPFMGSGSTGVAAKNLGFEFIGIEREAEYVEIAKRRIMKITQDYSERLL